MHEPDEVARTLLKSLLVTLHGLRDQAASLNEASAAASAVFRVMTEHFPDLAQKYEQYREEGRTSSPLASATRQTMDQYEKMSQQIQELLKTL